MYPVCDDITKYVNVDCIGKVLTILCPPRRYILPLFSEFHHGIDTEKIALLNAASQEMEHAYKVISLCAASLEERRYSGASGTVDSFDFDDVSESGITLKYISNTLRLIIQRSPLWILNAGDAADVGNISIELLDQLEPFMERRNISLHFEQEAKDAVLRLDEMMVRHVLWGVFALCIRHAANESSLNIIITRNETNGLQVSVEIGVICRDSLPRPDMDFYPCITPGRQNFASRLLPVLSAHIHTRIARYLLRRCGGRLVIQSPSKNSIRMVVAFAQ